MKDNTFINLVREICRKYNIELRERSDGWLLELRKNGMVHRVIGANFDLNDQVAYLMCRDKVAASTLLRDSGVNAIEHALLKSRGESEIRTNALKEMISEGDVVIKALEGSSGEHIYRVKSVERGVKIVTSINVPAWAISPYIDIEKEIRLIVVDGSIWLAHEKTDPVIRNEIKFFNLSKGAVARTLTLDELHDDWTELAVRTSNTIGTRLVAVDIAVTSEGEAKVLEVNSSFSLMHYALTNKATSSEVTLFYDRLIEYLFM